MEGMNTTLIWILIAIVVIALIIVGIVVIGNSRKKSKTISFDKPADQAPKELTQQEKSGNYQAKGGFAFAPAEVPEPVRVDNPVEPAEPAPGGSTAMSQLNEQLAQEPVAAPEPEIELSDDAADAVEELNDDVVEEGVEKPAVDGLSEDGRDIVEEAFEAEQDPEEDPEAEEAASIAAVTAEVADAARQEGAEVSEEAIVDTPAASEPIDEIAPAAGRIGKLRGRLSRSQNAIGQGLLGILTAGDLDEDAWEEIEDTLIMADLGTQLTLKVTESLRAKIAERGVSSEAEARAMLREALIEAAHPEMDRSIKAMPNEGKPAVILVVGVNGTGKTTTTGKLARVLVSMGHSVVLGAADTFRAAAADQLETRWIVRSRRCPTRESPP